MVTGGCGVGAGVGGVAGAALGATLAVEAGTTAMLAEVGAGLGWAGGIGAAAVSSMVSGLTVGELLPVATATLPVLVTLTGVLRVLGTPKRKPRTPPAPSEAPKAAMAGVQPPP